MAKYLSSVPAATSTPALGATGLCDCVVRMMGLVHKRETLTYDHTCLHLKGTNGREIW